MERLGGTLYFKVNGIQYMAKGEFTHNLGIPERTDITGPDGPHGFSEKQKPPFIKGAITDHPDLDLKAFQNLTDETVVLQQANGKTVVLENAYYCAEGDVTSEEGEVQVEFKGRDAEEIPA